MKFSAQEEYGLRCLIQIGRAKSGRSVTIPEISQKEGLSTHNVAKLLRILRRDGFIESVRGHKGGYALTRPTAEICIGEVLAALGGRLFDPGFCDRYSGITGLCTHSIDCSVRSVWKAIQGAVDHILRQTSLKDLLGTEAEQDLRMQQIREMTAETATFAPLRKGCELQQIKLRGNA